MNTCFSKRLIPVCKVFAICILCLSRFFQITVLGQTNLQTPEVDSISITADERPILSWFPNTDNTKYYRIERLRPGGTGDSIGVAWGINNTSFTDTVSILSPCDSIIRYKIIARAPGESPYVSAWSDELRTIWLQKPHLDICANTISLAWTGYINMPGDLGGYDIMASTDSVNYIVIGTNQPGDTAFIHTDILPDKLYSYQIRAFNKDRTKTSSSCKKTLQSRTYPKPQSIKIKSVSVENNDFIRVVWDIEPLVPILDFEVERSENNHFFEKIENITDPITYNPGRQYDDHKANFNAKSYYYQITLSDSCGLNSNPIYVSKIHRTIFLQGEPHAGYINELHWNHYEGWPDGIDKYRIYRDSGTGFALLTEVTANTDYFSDNVSTYASQGGVFSYFIEALENGNGQATSKSNQLTLEMETKILAPNAFIPEALPPDNEFKPIVSFIAEESYELFIFNKWGGIIFRTKNPQEGWDGKVDGKLQPDGAYVYIIKCLTPEGKPFEKKGTVTLIR